MCSSCCSFFLVLLLVPWFFLLLLSCIWFAHVIVSVVVLVRPCCSNGSCSAYCHCFPRSLMLLVYWCCSRMCKSTSKARNGHKSWACKYVPRNITPTIVPKRELRNHKQQLEACSRSRKQATTAIRRSSQQR